MTHILSTSQIESTLAHIQDLEARIDLLGDSDEDIRRADVLLQQINDALDALGESIPEKAERAVYVLRAAEAEAQRLKDAERSIAQRRAREERTIARLKGNVLPRLLAAHRERLSDPGANIRTDAGTIYATSSTRLEGPVDVFAWPEEFQRWPDRPSPDRAGARRHYASHPDELPDGFRFVTTTGVGIK